MGNYIFQLYQPQEIVDRNNKIYNEFIDKIIHLERKLEAIIKSSSKMNIYKILSIVKLNINMILNMRDFDKANKVIIKEYDIRNEELKQKFNEIMKSINNKINTIEEISLNSTQKCLESYNELVKIESDLLKNRNYIIDKLKIEDSINQEIKITQKYCNNLYKQKSAGKFVNIGDILNNREQFGGGKNFEEKYKKYKKKYKYLKKSNLYNNNGK